MEGRSCPMSLGQRDKKTGNFKFKTSLGCIARSYLQNKYIERGERDRKARKEGKQEVGRRGGKEGEGAKVSTTGKEWPLVLTRLCHVYELVHCSEFCLRSFSLQTGRHWSVLETLTGLYANWKVTCIFPLSVTYQYQVHIKTATVLTTEWILSR